MTCKEWYLKRKKKIIKTISWRVIATSTTFIIAYLIQGEADKAALVAAIDTVFKTILYYIHEGQCDKLEKKGCFDIEDDSYMEDGEINNVNIDTNDVNIDNEKNIITSFV